MDSWSDKVNVFTNMERNTVIITSKIIFAGLHIGVDIVLGPQQGLGFLNCNVHFEPVSAFGQDDAFIFDTTLRKPRLNGGKSLGRWSKSIRDLCLSALIFSHRYIFKYLLHCPVFAIVLAFRMRNIHQETITILEIALGQPK